MPRPSVVVLVAIIFAPPGALLGQLRVSQLVDSARVQLAANHLDSAEALLRSALDSTAPAAPADRNNALVWDGIVQFLRGHEDLARAAFRQALALDPGLEVNGLDQLSPELAQLFQQEQQAAGRIHGFYVSKDVDESPRRLSGPSVAYPRSLLRRHVQGFVQIAAIIDTTGPAEPASLEVLSTPVSGLIEPVKQMMVLVEAALDVTGHVEPGSAKVVQSPNHAFDEEALRVVRGSVYRPARRESRAGRAVIRQPISFVNY